MKKFLIIAVVFAAVVSSCSAERHLSKADKHIKKAIKKGAVMSSDTITRTISDTITKGDTVFIYNTNTVQKSDTVVIHTKKDKRRAYKQDKKQKRRSHKIEKEKIKQEGKTDRTRERTKRKNKLFNTRKLLFWLVMSLLFNILAVIYFIKRKI